MAERFKQPAVRNEVVRLVRSSTRDVMDVAEAVPYLIGDNLDVTNARRDLRVSKVQKGSLTLVSLINSVPTAVGTCLRNHCEHILRASLQERCDHLAIRASRLGRAPGRPDVLLCSVTRAGSSLR